MYLRTKFAAAAIVLRLVLFGAFATGFVWLPLPQLFLLLGFLWLLFSGRCLRRYLLPALFPSAHCPGCHRRLSLRARWQCDHFTAGVMQHVLQFQTPEGVRIAAFPCPCGTTIVVQGGDPKRYRAGTAVRLTVINELPATDSRSLVVGQDGQHRHMGIPAVNQEAHGLILGASGMGKTTLLLNFFDQIIRRGDGCTILDPKGDIARAAATRIPPTRETHTILLDLQDSQYPFPLNLLAVSDENEAAMITEELIQVFRRLHATSWGAVIEHQLRAIFRTVMAGGGNLGDVYRLCVDPAAAAGYLPRITDPTLRSFWLHEFPALPAARRLAVANKLAPILLQPILRDILSANVSAIDFDQVLSERHILIANLNAGGTSLLPTCMVGTFLVQKLLAAAIRQARKPASKRRRHFLLIDEFALFMDTADAAGFEQLLATARSYGLSLFVAHQHLDQLPLAVRAAVLGNVSTLIAFRVSLSDATSIAPLFRSFRPEHLVELERGRALLRVGPRAALVRTSSPLAPLPVDPTPRLRAAARQLARRQPPAGAPATVVPRAPVSPASPPVVAPDVDDDFVR